MAGCSTPATASFSVPAYTVPPPAQPTNVTVSNVQVTGQNTWTATVNATSSPGATAYKIFLDGTEVDNGTVTSFPQTIEGSAPGQTHQVGVSACN